MKIGIIGATGRMGKMLVRAVMAHDDAELSGVVGRDTSPHIGQDIGEICGIGTIGHDIGDDIKKLITDADAVIDFTTPESTLAHAKICAETGTKLIIGTTGLTTEQEAMLKSYADQTTIIYAPNMSIGVNLLLNLVKQVASKLDETYDIEIIEAHHRHKVDAPSGTALALGKSAAEGRKTTLEQSATYTREGIMDPREMGSIGFSTIRGGDIAGDHTVLFAAEGERIELTHKASDRSVFAKGAVNAAIWSNTKENGFYSMQDVLGLS